MRALIIIPTYNEVENLKMLIDQILNSTPETLEVLVVDDGSPDGTGEIAKQLSQASARVHLLERSKKMGLGSAYVAGFRWGLNKTFEAFIEMDADFSHDPKYLSVMLSNLERNDVVMGSRYVVGGGTENWTLFRRILSRGGSLYSRLILGAPIRDFTGGFNGWKRPVLEVIDLDSLRSDGYSFQIELKYRAFKKNFKMAEFPILFVDRKLGRSKMNRRIVFEALRRVWQFRFSSRIS